MMPIQKHTPPVPCSAHPHVTTNQVKIFTTHPFAALGMHHKHAPIAWTQQRIVVWEKIMLCQNPPIYGMPTVQRLKHAECNRIYRNRITDDQASA